MSYDRREIVRGLSLDVSILAGELYAAPDALGGDTAVRAIDRMFADLRRLCEQLVSERVADWKAAKGASA